MLLIAGANLLDPNFSRTVILLCDHRVDGSFGLVLNQLLPLSLSEIVQGIEDWDVPLYRGGPVQENTLHFIHRCQELDIGSQEILPGIFWGGDFETLTKHIQKNHLKPTDFRFFIGYSGWGEGQLKNEIERDSWYLTKASSELIFDADAKNHWRSVFRHMGPSYEMLTHFPDDPRLN